MISSAGVWQASDLLATLHDQTLRGIGLADAELRYVAPELMTGRSADVRSDVFTIGVLLYEMATGALPYDGRRCRRCSARCCGVSRSMPGRCSRRLPEPAAAALRRALRPTPEDRFPTAARSAPPSVPGPDDRIRRHRLAERLVEQVPVHQPVVRARLDQVEREPGQRLLHVDPQRARGQLAIGRAPRAGQGPFVVPFEGAVRQLVGLDGELLDLDGLARS